MADRLPQPSKRLKFRTWDVDADGALAAGLWGDDRVTALIGGPFDEAAVASRLASECQRNLDEGVQYWPVFLRDAACEEEFGDHVGAVGLRRYTGDAPSCAGLSTVFEVGFHLRPEHWGKGLGTEAATAVLDFAFGVLKVDAVFVGHNPKNTRSPKVLSKLGFRFTHEEFYQPTGLMHPSYILKAWPPPASASVPVAEAATVTGGDSSVAAVADATAARAALRGLYMVTGGFFFTFAGYAAIENLLSTFHQRLGYYSSAMVYYAIVPGAFVSPLIVGKLGPRLAMGFGALTYTAYAASIFLMEYGVGRSGILMLPCGAGVGITCSTLWTAMGVYCKQQSRAYDVARGVDSSGSEGSLGFFNGLSYAGVQAGTLSAMLCSSVVMQLLGPRRKLIFGALFTVATLGNAALFLLPTAPLSAAEQAAVKAAGTTKTSLGSSLVAMPRLLARSKTMRWLFVCMISCGFSSGFASGSFTADAAAPSLGEQWLGYVVAAKAGCSTTASLLLGKVSDRVGRYPVFLGAIMLELVTPAFFSFFDLAVMKGNRVLVFALACAMGFGASGANIMVKTMAGDLFDGPDTAPALACSTAATGFTAGSSFLLGPNASLRTKSRVFTTLTVCSLLSATVGVLPALLAKAKARPAGKDGE